jgi:hypothetical protein
VVLGAPSVGVAPGEACCGWLGEVAGVWAFGGVEAEIDSVVAVDAQQAADESGVVVVVDAFPRAAADDAVRSKDRDQPVSETSDGCGGAGITWPQPRAGGASSAGWDVGGWEVFVE